MTRHASPTLAALYDAHGGSAFTLAFAMLAHRGAAAEAVQQAFQTPQREAAPSIAPDAKGRALLLHHVFRAAARDARQPAQRDGVAGVVHALAHDEREVLLLCLHRVTCADLAAIHHVASRTIAAQLHCALNGVRDALAASASTSPARARRGHDLVGALAPPLSELGALANLAMFNTHDEQQLQP